MVLLSNPQRTHVDAKMKWSYTLSYQYMYIYIYGILACTCSYHRHVHVHACIYIHVHVHIDVYSCAISHVSRCLVLAQGVVISSKIIGLAMHGYNVHYRIPSFFITQYSTCLCMYSTSAQACTEWLTLVMEVFLVSWILWFNSSVLARFSTPDILAKPGLG